MLVLYSPTKRINILPWFIVGISLFLSLHITAQEEFKEDLKQAKRYVYENPEKAVKQGEIIYNKATDLDTKISALITLVNGYTTLNDHKTAMNYAVEAKDIAEKSKDIHSQIRTLGLLGEQYQLYHLNSISREYLKQAEKLLSSSNFSKEEMAVSQANIYAVKGNSYKDQIDCLYAIENYNRAISIYKSLPEHTGAQNNLALVYLEKGTCLVDLEDLESASKSFCKAKEIATTNGLIEYINYANLGLAKIEIEKEDYDSAMKRLLLLKENESLLALSNIKFQLVELLKENYKHIEDFESYLYTQQKYTTNWNVLVEEENANFEQIWSFIHTLNLEEKSFFSFRKIIIYSLISMFFIIGTYEVKLYYRRKNSDNK